MLSCAQQRVVASTLLGNLWRSPAQPCSEDGPQLSAMLQLADPEEPIAGSPSNPKGIAGDLFRLLRSLQKGWGEKTHHFAATWFANMAFRSIFCTRRHFLTTTWLARPHHGTWKGDRNLYFNSGPGVSRSTLRQPVPCSDSC